MTTQSSSYSLKPEISRKAFDAALKATLLMVPEWEAWLRPTLSTIVDAMIETGTLPIAMADALDDVGNLLQRLAQEIMAERGRRRMPLPLGPDDEGG